MAMDPDFFTRRSPVGAVLDPALDLSRTALMAAIETATAPPARRLALAEIALRALRDACFAAPPRVLVELTFPLDAEGLVCCLERPLADWLPFASELGAAEDRLVLLGQPTSACRDLRWRFS